MEEQNVLEKMFVLADKEFDGEVQIEKDKCRKTKKFVSLVLETLKPNHYMEMTYRDCNENEICVIVGKGWVGSKTRSGELTFELAPDLNPCKSSKEYSASTIHAAIENPSRAKIKVKEIRRHEFNSCYFKELDSFLRSIK